MQMQTIKKVATGAIGLFLTGATLMGPALAAADLGDFQSMKPSDTLIVVGAKALTEDVVGGINIGGKLAQSGIGSATCSVTCEDTGVSKVTDGVKIETSSKKLRLSGASIQGSLGLVKSSLAAKDLDLLKKQDVVYTDSSKTTVNQVLTLYGDTNVTFSETDNDGETVENPRMILRQGASTPMYKLDITSPAGLNINQSSESANPDYQSNAPGLAGEDIKILGKTFTVGTDADITSTKLVLFGGGEEKTLVAAGDSITFELDGKSHTIRMTSWQGTGSTLKGIFELDGVSYTKGENTAITVNAETNSQVTIKTVSEVKVPSSAGGAATEGASATIFIGSDKLTLEDQAAVKIGDTTVSGSLVEITRDGSIIKTINVTYTPDEALVAEVGGVIKDPIFSAFDLAFAGVAPADKASSKEKFEVSKGGSKVKLKFSNNQGSEYSIDLKVVSGTVGSETWTYGGTAGTQKLWVAQNAASVTKGSSFFISDGTDSYVLKYKSIDTTDNVVTFEDVATAEEIDVGYTGSTGTLYLGAATFAVTGITDVSTSTITVADADQGTSGSSGNVVMKTKNGATFVIGADSSSAPFVTFTETDDQSDTDKAVINVTVAETTSGSVGIDTIDYAVSDAASGGTGAALSGGNTGYQLGDSKVYEDLTVYGTYLVRDTDADTVTMYYPDDQVTANVYVMKHGVNPPTTSATGTTKSQTINVNAPSLGNGIAKLDSEISDADKEAKNLILVGGPAANNLVRDLAADGKTPDMAYWEANLKGKFILQAVADAFADGKKAIVVAGWSAADTQAASLKLATEDLSGAAKSCIGTSCSDLVYPPATPTNTTQ